MTNSDIEILRKFVAEIERRAEEKMLKTGKLEGAHYAAMKQVFKEWTTPQLPTDNCQLKTPA